MENKLILFGAGNNGKEAIKRYGKERVAFYADNAKEKVGTYIDGLKVLSFEEMLEKHKEGYVVMVTPDRNSYIIGQLEANEINDYLIFEKIDRSEYIESRNILARTFRNNNAELENYAQKTTEINPLENIKVFKTLSAEVLKKNKEGMSLFWRGAGDEGRYYGNFKGIETFAGLPEDSALYFPTVSHEDCAPLFSPAFKYRSAVAFSGKYYRNRVHEHRPYVPVFTVGPYIHYVKGMYDDKKVESIKVKNGRTLLAFLPHSIEFVGRLYDKRDFVDKILELYGSSFKHIILCAYWADINDPVCEYASEYGIQVVSAGFRFDEEFDRRLRTIISLCDAVVCGDIGTHIAYSLCLNKPIARIDITNDQTIKEGEMKSELEKQIEFSADYEQYKKGFFRYFDEEFKLTQDQIDWMNPVAGFDQIRSVDYIRMIYRISKDIWKHSDGNLKLYAGAVTKTYYEYDKDCEFQLMSILKESLGCYLF